MKNKIDINEAAKLRLQIKKVDASLGNIISLINQQVIPITHALLKEDISQNQKLSKSLSTLVATGENQRLRFMKLIDMLEKRPSMVKLLKVLDKTNRKGDKLIAELRVAESKLENYICITEEERQMVGLHASCKSCAAALTEYISEFETNDESINNFLINNKKEN